MASSVRLRAISSTLDQVMSSASNGLVILAVARVAAVDAFGIASLLFAINAAALGFMRGAAGTPLMLSSSQTTRALRRESGFAVTAALIFGAIIGGVTFVVAVWLGSPQVGIAFAIAIPLVLIQDVLRYAAISSARPTVALTWDAVWAGGSAAILGVTWIWQDRFHESEVLLGWASLGGVAAVGLAVKLTTRPQFGGILNWWRETAGARIRFGLESALEQLNVIVIVLMSTVLIGASAAAVLRGASTVLSPFAILMSALPLVIIPESVRTSEPPRKVWRKLRTLGAVGSSTILGVGLFVSLIPNSTGELLLGDSWEPTKTVLPIIGIEYAASAWLFVSLSFFRFQAKSSELLRARIAYAAVSIVGCSVMAVVTKSAVGVAIGLAFAAVVAAAWTYFLARPTRSMAPPTPPMWSGKHRALDDPNDVVERTPE